MKDSPVIFHEKATEGKVPICWKSEFRRSIPQGSRKVIAGIINIIETTEIRSAIRLRSRN